MSGPGEEDVRSSRAGYPWPGSGHGGTGTSPRRGGRTLEVGALKVRLVAQLQAQPRSGWVEPREKPTSTPESGADLAVTPTRGPTEFALRRRPMAEVETAGVYSQEHRI